MSLGERAQSKFPPVRFFKISDVMFPVQCLCVQGGIVLLQALRFFHCVLNSGSVVVFVGVRERLCKVVKVDVCNRRNPSAVDRKVPLTPDLKHMSYHLILFALEAICAANV